MVNLDNGTHYDLFRTDHPRDPDVYLISSFPSRNHVHSEFWVALFSRYKSCRDKYNNSSINEIINSYPAPATPRISVYQVDCSVDRHPPVNPFDVHLGT